MLPSLSAVRTRLNISSALGGASVAFLAFSLPITPAQAADECGAAVAGAVFCAPSGNPYAGGISYDPGVDDLTVVLEDGVVVAANGLLNRGVTITSTTGNISLMQGAGAISSTGVSGDGVQMSSSYGGDVTAALTTISTSGDGARGVAIAAGQGAASVVAGTVTTIGESADGISVFGRDSLALEVGAVSTVGKSADGIALFSDGALTAQVGQVTTAGDDAEGIWVRGKDTVDLTAGSVATSGANSDGVVVQTYGTDVVTKVDLGDVNTAGEGSIGVNLISAEVLANVANVETQGVASTAILINSSGSTDLTVGSISTVGDNSYGVGIRADTTADLTVTGDIETQGIAARGVDVYAGYGAATVTVANISTTGQSADGIAIDAGEDATLTVTGTVATAGDYSDAVYVSSYAGSITANLVDVSTTGRGSDAVRLDSGSGRALPAGCHKQIGLKWNGCGPSTAGRATAVPMVRQRSECWTPLYLPYLASRCRDGDGGLTI